MTEKIRVVIKKVGKRPTEEYVENTLKSFQNIVGGNIEVFSVRNCLCICNEEGKINGLLPNFYYRGNNDVIMGDVCFVGAEGEDFASLSDAQVEFLMGIF